MSQTLSDRLSIDQIARLWVAETEKGGFGAEDIAGDLVRAAELGDFEHPTHSRADAPLGEYTYEEPQEDGTVEIRKTKQAGVGPYRSAMSMRDEQPVNGAAIQNYIKARQTAPGATDRETRRIVARDNFLSVEGLRRWCDEPGFAEWAKLRGLSRPRFIDRASGDGTGQASAVDQEPEEDSTAEAAAGESADFLILDPGVAPDPILEETVLIEPEGLLLDATSPSPPRKKPAKPAHDRWVERGKELKALNPSILTSAIASKLRNEDLRFNEPNMKSKGPNKMRVIRETSTIRRVLHRRQSEWDIPPES